MKKLLLLSLVLLLISDLSYSQKAYGSELSATVAIPTGPSSEYYNTGYGAIGGFYYDMESNWRLGLTLGFIRFGVNSTEVLNIIIRAMAQLVDFIMIWNPTGVLG